MTKARDVMAAIELVAPNSLAGEWDNCGLQVGDPASGVGKVLVALTPLPEVFEEADEMGADFLLFHHPLICGSGRIGTLPGPLSAEQSRRHVSDRPRYGPAGGGPRAVTRAPAGRGPRRVRGLVYPGGRGLRR